MDFGSGGKWSERQFPHSKLNAGTCCVGLGVHEDGMGMEGWQEALCLALIWALGSPCWLLTSY